MLHRWYLAARASRQRRVVLRQKEDEMKLATIAVTWDKWRARFNDEKLRPIVSLTVSRSSQKLKRSSQEYSVIIRSHTNSLFRAFGVWRSKTKVAYGLPMSVLLNAFVQTVCACNSVSCILYKSQVLGELASNHASSNAGQSGP
jgi:hypothetical protein